MDLGLYDDNYPMLCYMILLWTISRVEEFTTLIDSWWDVEHDWGSVGLQLRCQQVEAETLNKLGFWLDDMTMHLPFRSNSGSFHDSILVSCQVLPTARSWNSLEWRESSSSWEKRDWNLEPEFMRLR
jgi:hypothetical protein